MLRKEFPLYPRVVTWTEARLVVPLVESTRDGPVTFLMVATLAFGRLRGIHAGGIKSYNLGVGRRGDQNEGSEANRLPLRRKRRFR
jgi:hypothetical protein